ncbi:tetratricopeptide repeat-containing sensor histidine kinase [Flavobacterium sp. LC2016-12]|uniref:tetratricopeptide repeat-containing sensor histidine kinase n=1 Tax=Flavobacterium sp. LC2016-12 TaxID=2783794 RepID=UPI00188AEC01|nr:tetratricopeptide repeat-containing sensor histidine kinase [Flavobacterium sp. LC2016-12]MBF4467066.1 ATP-binding protein [Flavobacterium sp. LC2016-12]
MTTKRPQINLFIILLFLILFSCQKRKETSNAVPKNTKSQVIKLTVIADRFYDDKKFDSAFYYYNKIKSICHPITDSENFISTLNNIAEIQRYHGDYDGSELTLTEAIPYLKYVKKQKHIWNNYIEFGNTYLSKGDYGNANLYYNKALELKTSEWRKLSAENNIAVVLLEQHKYKEALQIYLRLSKEKEIIEVTENYAKVLDNIGFCYFKIGDIQAVSYFNKALQLTNKINDNWESAKVNLHLAKFYYPNNVDSSTKYALVSYDKYTSVHDVDGRMSALKQLIANTKDHELKKYSLLYIKVNDSITEVRQKAKNQFAKIKYDSKKEKEENLKLKTHKAENELQLERQKNRNIISYILIVLSLSLIVVLYFYLTSRGNREKIEATYKSETRIAKKLHDELANDIYHTMAFAENRNLSIVENKEQLLINLDAIYSRTRDISKENSPVITNEKYTFYLKEMISGFNTSNINFILNDIESVPWNEIEKNKKITIYRILQELLVNMKKHSSATLVGINFKKTDKSVIINYTDNGKGIDINNMIFKNGLHNVENRILSIKGEIDIDTEPNKGFKVFIKFPL